jgi:hypothetical protein
MQYRAELETRFAFPRAAGGIPLLPLARALCVLIIASESSSFNFNNASFRP